MSGGRIRWLTVWMLLLGLLSSSISRAQEATPSPATAVATPDPTAADLAPVLAQDAYRLAFLNPHPENEFWQSVQAAILTRADVDAVTIDVFALDTPSAPMQIAQINEAIAVGYDGIILGAVDAVGIVPGLVAANDAGVPVLAIEVAPAGGQIVTLVQTDEVAAAQMAGEFIATAIGGAGIVLNLQGDMTTLAAQNRDQGVRAAWQHHADIDVLSENAAWNQAVATGIARGHLVPDDAGTPTPANPRFRAIFAANDAMALGAVESVLAAGRDDLVTVGFGGTTAAFTAIEAGELTATVALLPHRAGALSVDALVRHLNGESVPSRIDPGAILVTIDIVGQFVEQATE